LIGDLGTVITLKDKGDDADARVIDLLNMAGYLLSNSFTIALANSSEDSCGGL